jgi:hypothetical protein
VTDPHSAQLVVDFRVPDANPSNGRLDTGSPGPASPRPNTVSRVSRRVELGLKPCIYCFPWRERLDPGRRYIARERRSSESEQIDELWEIVDPKTNEVVAASGFAQWAVTTERDWNAALESDPAFTPRRYEAKRRLEEESWRRRYAESQSERDPRNARGGVLVARDRDRGRCRPFGHSGAHHCSPVERMIDPRCLDRARVGCSTSWRDWRRSAACETSAAPDVAHGRQHNAPQHCPNRGRPIAHAGSRRACRRAHTRAGARRRSGETNDAHRARRSPASSRVRRPGARGSSRSPSSRT